MRWLNGRQLEVAQGEVVSLDALSREIGRRGWYWKMDRTWFEPHKYEASVHVKHGSGGYSVFRGEGKEPVDALLEAFKEALGMFP